MSRYLQRLCWNTQGWTTPSGGKFGTENSYPGKYGFGHEEWNFNTADAVDGYVYGHIYRRYENLGQGTSPGPHDFYFWSRQDPSSPSLLIGAYHDAVFVPPEERKRVFKKLTSNGVIRRRARELSNLGLPSKALSRIGSPITRVLDDFPVLRVRKESVEAFSHRIPLTSAFRGVPRPMLTRYNQFAKLDRAQKIAGLYHPASPSHGEKEVESERVDYYWRQTAAKSKRVERHEEILRKRVEAFLRKSAPKPFVSTEVGHTDLIAERNDHRCLMELKTCQHVASKIAARAALGQLLYYAYHRASGSEFARTKPPDSLCIVMDKKPDADTLAWLKELSRRFGVTADLAWPSGKRFTSAFATTPFF